MTDPITIDDFELETAARKAIWQDNILREARAPLEIRVENGAVTVNGWVRSENQHERLLFRLATIPGVVKVIDRLFSDPKIAQRVAAAVAADPTLSSSQVEVSSYYGQVTLHGFVSGTAKRDALVALASGVAGVQDVVDRLTVE
jgi:osmotically-inducible protein OsmY